MKQFDTSILDAMLQQKRHKLEAERQSLFHTLRDYLCSIQKKYHVKEAYIIGSLLSPKLWSQFSDVDVAVAGTSEHIFKIMKELEEKTNKDVDVIDLDCHPHPEVIKRRGEKVYG